MRCLEAIDRLAHGEGCVWKGVGMGERAGKMAGKGDEGG